MPQRALTADFKGDDDMTVEMCAEYCTPYQYFGVEYGRECYCGNDRAADSVAAPDADCSFACAGDTSETCGAGMRLNVYTNNAYSTSKPADTAPPGTPYFGCFVDAAARVLPERVISADDMTPAKCAANCVGYTYFGTEWSRECYCGNIAPTEVAGQSECNMACSGNAAEMCGAGMRLSVYGPVGAAPTNPDTVSDFNYDGCYTDLIDLRTLPGSTVTSADMTLTSCAAICADYNYFGLEHGDQCFCGMDVDPSAVKLAEADCALKCSGDDSLVCGGANRLTVYKKNAAPSVPSNPATVGAFKYQSCWTDAVGARSLTAKSEVQAEMTVEMCAAFCEGYAYFGVEYSTECYCGNELAGSQSAAEADCSMLCAGSASQWCGGPNRLNLYAVNSITSSSSSISNVPPSSTVDATPTITPGPQLTTVTSCPPSSTLVGGPQTSCWWKMPSPCAALATVTQEYSASMSLQMCTLSLGRPLPTNVASCFPSYFDYRNTASTIYSCMQTAGIACSFASECATSTYMVGQEPSATAVAPVSPTAALQNPGFEAGNLAGWTFTQPLTPFNTQDVSGVRVHSGSQAFRAVFLNDNSHSTGMSQIVPVVPGANYTLAAWVSHDNPANSLCTIYVSGAPYVSWAQTQQSFRDVPAGVWRQVSVNFQAGASYAAVNLSFSCTVSGAVNSNPGKNTLYIDEVTLVRTDI